jgi:uncharacterized membrane protein
MLRARRNEISRLEAFSDAAFAFALTLLVVSLDVPKSYEQLAKTMAGFPSFACCFALLVWIWHEHNLFFRRYGLDDSWTVFINSMLLFVTLFYVYPLKFMFDSMFAQMMPTVYADVTRMSLVQLSRASAIYGLGFLVLFVLFALLYRHVHTRRDDLGLTTIEVFDVKMYAGHHLVSAGVGLVAVLVAVGGPLYLAPLSPMCFALMGPAHWWFGLRVDRRRRALLKQLGPAVA